LTPSELPLDLTCRFVSDGAAFGPLAVLDVASAGVAIAAPDVSLPPGSELGEFEIRLGDHPIWSGAASVVHETTSRLGVRFQSGVLDLGVLRVHATVQQRLDALREQRRVLPAAWRAAVSDVRQLLEDAKFEVEDLERADAEDPLRREEEEAQLFASLREHWGAEFYGSLAALHELSKPLEATVRPHARSYAASALMPLLYACPMHRRAYDKPLGYAGDFRMMELYFARQLTGDGMFGRFLHSIGQNYALGHTVIAREAVMHDAVKAAIEAKGEGPVRILSLAAGPAIELRRLLDSDLAPERPVELILLDQDEAAHEAAHRRLSRILLERHHNRLPVKVTGLHFSVRQLLKPQTDEEKRIVKQTLSGLDLVYSAGLYDYLPHPVAARLTHQVYGMLAPGGRFLLGNLVEAADTTWMMDFVMGWELQYRVDATMLSLAAGLAPEPVGVGITRDRTGYCMFLDARRPA
jgi:extracellular factor (EF) 3-hydroxypalmitic acid methyl ester biosynthesis protein